MGWLLISIVVPIAAPLCLLALYILAPLPASAAANTKPLNQIKDAQLCWTAMGFCASGLYEIAEAPLPLEKAVANWSNGGLYLCLLISAILALAGATYPTPLAVPPGKSWAKHFALMLGSMALTAATGGAYTLIHFMVNP